MFIIDSSKLHRAAALLFLAAVLLFFWHIFQDRSSDFAKLESSSSKLTGLQLKFLVDQNIEDAERQKVFIKALQPVIESENERITFVRRWIKDFDRGVYSTQPMAREWLCDVAAAFRLPCPQQLNHQFMQMLLYRVDIVPDAWIIAQAARQSDWGHAWYVSEANNLFNQICYEQGCGVSESDFIDNAYHACDSDELVLPIINEKEKRLFSSLHESVRTYLIDVNSLPSFKQLRAQRASCEKMLNGKKRSVVMMEDQQKNKIGETDLFYKNDNMPYSWKQVLLLMSTADIGDGLSEIDCSFFYEPLHAGTFIP